MENVREGTLHIGARIRVPARFWGADWARDNKDEHGDDVEYDYTVINHRLPSKGVSEEWEAVPAQDESIFISKRWMNKFLDEGRVTGAQLCCSAFISAHLLLQTHVTDAYTNTNRGFGPTG